MVHRSMIQEFITDCVLSGERDVTSLTVHDLLVGSQSAAIFRHTFAVDRSADMDQALAAMNTISGCQDVFVTSDGTPNGAVIGWLTNTMYMCRGRAVHWIPPRWVTPPADRRSGRWGGSACPGRPARRRGPSTRRCG